MVSQTLKSTLISQIASLSNPKTADWWENYVKHGAKFRGVGIPTIREELKKWYITANISGLPLDYQLDIALSFFEEEYSEDKLAGILFLQLYLYDKFDHKTLLPRFVQLFEKGMILDWNICDWFCVRVLGPMILRDGMDCAEDISKWDSADNVWQARCSVVAFANIANDGNFTDILIESSRKLIAREERFAKTAVGWILREISRNDKAKVSDFVRDHFAHFSKESLENSIKYFADDEKRLMRKKLG